MTTQYMYLLQSVTDELVIKSKEAATAMFGSPHVSWISKPVKYKQTS